VLDENPNHSKVLQQLGWIYHQDGSSFQNQESAISCLTKSLESGQFIHVLYCMCLVF
jgi:glucose repression mediator protein